jgi:glycosyltransferase involved in cell wall biosynthesis
MTSGISVVLASYNHARFVEAALRALLAQAPAPTEIIVIDDASTDDSMTVVERFATANPAIRVLANSENLGVIRSQKRGLAIASAPYVYFAAADDIVLPGFFGCALHLLQAHPRAGLFCGDMILVDGETGIRAGIRPVVIPFCKPCAADPERTRRMLRRFDNWIATGSTIVRRDALEQAGGLDESFGSFADGYLLRKIALMRGFCYAPRAVAEWRIFQGGVSRQSSLNVEKATEILRTVPARIAADPAFPDWYPRLFRDRWAFASSRLALESRPIHHALLDAMAADSPLDLRALRLIRTWLGRSWLGRSPALERTATLAWLALRLRPYPLSALVVTRLVRWLRRRADA